MGLCFKLYSRSISIPNRIGARGRDLTQGQSGVGKVKKRLLFLEIFNWETVTTTMQIHNGHKEWSPLELFKSHIVHG